MSFFFFFAGHLIHSGEELFFCPLSCCPGWAFDYFRGKKFILFVCFFSMEKFSEMCCLQFLLHVCVDFTRLYLWFSWFFFCSVLYFCFVFFVYCDIFGLLWRGLVFRLVSKWRTYWKHGVNFWTQKTNAKKLGQDDDEDYRGLSHGDTSHIIVWQVHCWVKQKTKNKVENLDLLFAYLSSPSFDPYKITEWLLCVIY